MTTRPDDAIDRLVDGYYNSRAWHAVDNPGGLDESDDGLVAGHVTNFPAALEDAGAAVAYAGVVVIEAEQFAADAAGSASAAAQTLTNQGVANAAAIAAATGLRDQSQAAATAAAQSALTAAGLIAVRQPGDVAGIPPILDFPFSSPAAVPPGFIAGSSGKWVMGQHGLYTFVPAGTAPIEHDPLTGALRGLLVEEARTNLLLRSSAFGHAAWTQFGCTVASDATMAPDGTLTADKLIEDTSTGIHNVRQVGSSSNGVAYTGSVYVKAGGRTQVRLVLESSGTIGIGDYDLVAGTATLQSGTAAAISAVGNGWYRCTLVAVANSTSIALNVRTLNAIGDGGSGLYLWQAQVESGTFTTSPIPTTSAAVTRAADVNALALSAVPGWSAMEGTIYVEFDAPAYDTTGTTQRGAMSLYADSNNRISLMLTNNNPNTVRMQVVNGGANQVLIDATYVANSVSKVAAAWATNDFAVCQNAATVLTDTSGTVPTFTTLGVGNRAGDVVFCGHIRRLTLFPRRLSNAAIQLMTA